VMRNVPIHARKMVDAKSLTLAHQGTDQARDPASLRHLVGLVLVRRQNAWSANKHAKMKMLQQGHLKQELSLQIELAQPGSKILQNVHIPARLMVDVKLSTLVPQEVDKPRAPASRRISAAPVLEPPESVLNVKRSVKKAQ